MVPRRRNLAGPCEWQSSDNEGQHKIAGGHSRRRSTHGSLLVRRAATPTAERLGVFFWLGCQSSCRTRPFFASGFAKRPCVVVSATASECQIDDPDAPDPIRRRVSRKELAKFQRLESMKKQPTAVLRIILKATVGRRTTCIGRRSDLHRAGEQDLYRTSLRFQQLESITKRSTAVLRIMVRCPLALSLNRMPPHSTEK